MEGTGGLFVGGEGPADVEFVVVLHDVLAAFAVEGLIREGAGGIAGKIREGRATPLLHFITGLDVGHDIAFDSEAQGEVLATAIALPSAFVRRDDWLRRNWRRGRRIGRGVGGRCRYGRGLARFGMAGQESWYQG